MKSKAGKTVQSGKAVQSGKPAPEPRATAPAAPKAAVPAKSAAAAASAPPSPPEEAAAPPPVDAHETPQPVLNPVVELANTTKGCWKKLEDGTKSQLSDKEWRQELAHLLERPAAPSA